MQPGNHWLLLTVRTAKAWGRRPTELMPGWPLPGSKDGRRRLDAKLMLALQKLEDETCSSCGTVSWLGRSEDNVIQFKLHTSTCYACADLEQDRDDRGKSRSTHYGETRYVVPVHALDADLPLPTREDWLRRLGVT